MASTIEIDETWNEDKALRKYSHHKGWYTKHMNKVAKMKELVDKSFDVNTHARMHDTLNKAEGAVAVLAIIAQYLKQINYARWKEHMDEVEKLESDIAVVWDLVIQDDHKRSSKAVPAAPGTPGTSRPRPPAPQVDECSKGMKLVSDLKPFDLAHDASAGDVRVWQKKFESYYTASFMNLGKLSVQQAHFLNCVDKNLALELDSLIQPTTPVIGAGVTCMYFLSSIFKKKYPLLLRRKNFFSMTQQAGQDEHSFAEKVKAAATEADIAGMGLHDSICLVLLSGIKDARLRERMSEVETPDLATFMHLIDSHMHGKATTGAHSAATSNRGRGRGSGRGGYNNTGSRQPAGVSDQEKKRRAVLKGKCYRCGADHFANACTLSRDVRCNKCKATGHIQSACVQQAQARVAAGEDRQTQQQQSPMLQLEYQGEQRPAESCATYVSFAGGETRQAEACAIPNSNQPTPPLLL